MTHARPLLCSAHATAIDIKGPPGPWVARTLGKFTSEVPEGPAAWVSKCT
jgi:hypothetical protein